MTDAGSHVADVLSRETISDSATFATRVSAANIPTMARVPDAYWQVLNLKDASRVLQEKAPLVLMYSWAYQNVQSSLGSIAMLL
jgi:hypothetical protein